MREKDDKLCTFQIRIYRLIVDLYMWVQKDGDLFEFPGEILTMLNHMSSGQNSGLQMNVEHNAIVTISV